MAEGDVYHIQIYVELVTVRREGSHTKKRAERMTRTHFLKVNFFWLCGWLFIIAIGALWLGALSVTFYLAYKGTQLPLGIFALLALVLLAVGDLFVIFVNRFHGWWVSQRDSVLIENYLKEKREQEQRDRPSSNIPQNGDASCSNSREAVHPLKKGFD